MKITETTLIPVYNYSSSICCVGSNIKPEGYLFEGAKNEDEPFSIPLTFSEIRTINSQSDIFRNGILRFEKEYEKDVYEALGIRDWQNILTDKEIKNIILNPTPEGLKKIIAINNPAMFERVRGVFVQLRNSKMYDISMRVAELITERYKELYRGQRNSSIKIKIENHNVNNQVKSSQIDINKIIQSELEKAKEDLKKQLEQQIREQLEAEYKAKLEEKPKNNNTNKTNNKYVKNTKK